MRTRSGPAPRTFGESTRHNLPLLALGGLFIAGALCGRALYGSLSSVASGAMMFLLSGAGTESAFHFWSDFGSIFLSNFLTLALLFLCGFCAVSQPVILLLPFVKGLGFGLVAAYNTALLSPYSAFFWIKFLPGAFLATVLILLCARQSLALSCFCYRSVFGGAPKEGRFLPASYGAQYVLFTVVCAGFSLIDALFDLVYEVVSNA